MNGTLVGYAERDITPGLGSELCGYGFYLDRKARKIIDRLKARTVVIKNKEAEICLISCDLIGLSIEFSNSLSKKISQQTGIKEESILISSTHTHSGPVTIKFSAGMGKINNRHMQKAGSDIIDSAIEAISNYEPAEMGYAIRKIETIGFNRVTGESSPLDNLLSVIVFKIKYSKNLFLVNYACHPVTLGINDGTSADYPGRVIKEIESIQGDKGIFFQGCCGDIDPLVNKAKWGSGTEKDIMKYGKHIFREITKVTEGISFKQDIEIKSTKRTIRIPLQIPDIETIKESEPFGNKDFDAVRLNSVNQKFHNAWLNSAIEAIQNNRIKPYVDNVPVQGIKMGEIVIIGLPGEVFSEIGLKIKQIYKNTIVIGCANGVIGYIPTSETYMSKDYRAGYACCFSCRMYPYLFPFAKRVEDIVIEESRIVLDSLI